MVTPCTPKTHIRINICANDLVDNDLVALDLVFFVVVTKASLSVTLILSLTLPWVFANLVAQL